MRTMAVVYERLLRRVGYHPAKPGYPPDFSPADIQIVEEVVPFTMTSPERIFALCRSVEYVVRCRIPGDLVECGVWRGGSMMAIAKTLMRLGDTSRSLYLFDTFEGMTPPGTVDRTFRGEAASDLLTSQDRGTSWTWAYAPLEAVKEAIYRTGYDRRRIHFIRGKVEDTLPSRAPGEIAVLRLDTDWYESTYHELIHLYPRISPGGVMIVDDYGHWEGARRAVDQYIAENEVEILLNRIDYTGRVGVKPKI